MFRFLYEWMINAAIYLVLFTAVIQLLPNESYQKYIRFFTGLIMIILILTPVFKILGMEQTFREIYESRQNEQEKKELEDSLSFPEESEWTDDLPDLYGEQDEQQNLEGDIHVEKIWIGE